MKNPNENQTKHTPEKWLSDSRVNLEVGISPVGRDFTCYVFSETGNCVFRASGATAEEAVANANIGAAAPELLEMLQQLLFAHECADETGYVEDVGFIDLDALRDKCRAAIAKATGQPSK